MTQTASFLEHSFMLFGTDCNGTAARFTLMDCGFMRFQNTRRLFVSRCGHIACKMSLLLWVYEWKEALNADVIIEKTWKDNKRHDMKRVQTAAKTCCAASSWSNSRSLQPFLQLQGYQGLCKAAILIPGPGIEQAKIRWSSCQASRDNERLSLTTHNQIWLSAIRNISKLSHASQPTVLQRTLPRPDCTAGLCKSQATPKNLSYRCYSTRYPECPRMSAGAAEMTEWAYLTSFDTKWKEHERTCKKVWSHERL